MSSQCPVCQASLHDDFGLIECNACGAQLIVHMDGHVEYAASSNTLATQVKKKPAPPPKQEALGFSADDFSGDLDPYAEPEPEFDPDPTEMIDSSPANPAFAPPADFAPPPESGLAGDLPEDDIILDQRYGEPAAANDDFEVEEDPAPEQESDALPPPPEEEYVFDGNDDANQSAGNVYNSASSPSSSDLSDVASFGNSGLSGGRDGSLRYNLFIEGIDTSDVRAAFREALTDRKLMWDTDQILRSLRNGKVSIPNVPPTKAHILISRLRGMPVQVRWEQYAISQT